MTDESDETIIAVREFKLDGLKSDSVFEMSGTHFRVVWKNWDGVMAEPIEYKAETGESKRNSRPYQWFTIDELIEGHAVIVKH